MTQKSSLFVLPFIRKEKIAKSTYSFFFDRTGIDFDFLPGQYIRMTVPHENSDDRGTSRFFTIASSPHETGHLMITTKLFQSTFKETLHALIPGTPVQFFGPMGNFILDESDRTPRVFLAGGVGITPFYSMIQYAAAKDLAIPMTLIASFTHPDEVVFYEELLRGTQKNKNFKIVYTVAQSATSWAGQTGKLSGDLLKENIANMSDASYAIVGSLSFVAATKELLRSLFILEGSISTEDFTGYR